MPVVYGAHRLVSNGARLGLISVVLMTMLSAESPKVACTTFTCSDDLGPSLCEAYERRFTSRLARGQKVQVTTPRDIAQILGLERQKQLLGCSNEDGSCSAELAGALGVDGLLTAIVTRTPSGWLLSMKVVRATDGVEWVSANENARDDGELQDVLDGIADRFAKELQGVKPGGASRAVLWSGTALGLGLVAGGAVLLGLSKPYAARLKSDEPQSPTDLDQTASQGATLQTAGGVLLGVGIPVALTFFILALALPAESGGVSVAPLFTSDTAYVSVGGRW